MFNLEALDLLGLSIFDARDAAAINAAYKRKIREVHPDKSGSVDATKRTQALNEAKATLLKNTPEYFLEELERRQREAQEEQAAQELDRQRKEKENFDAWCDELYEKAKEARRERQIRNRKKRDPTKRAHVPALSNPVVLGLLEEMNHFFESKFEATKEWRNHVYTKDILKLFMSTRDGKETSPLEQNMFLRHCQTVIKTVFPDARYTKHKCHRAYVYIRPIPEK